MKNKELNPYVRYVDRVTKPIDYPEKILAYDFRMFYLCMGVLSFETNDGITQLSEGDLLTVPPATEYRLLYTKDRAFSYYILNFDFISDFDNIPPRPPVPSDSFSLCDVISFESVSPYDGIALIHNVHHAEKLLERIFECNTNTSSSSKNMQSALLKYLLASASNTASSTSNLSTLKITEKVKKYISDNYSLTLSYQALASLFGYHPNYLNSLFLKNEGVTLHKYINLVKMSHAKDMLLHSDMLIGEIAEKCGYEDVSYFCKVFLKNTGMTPKKYRNIK